MITRRTPRLARTIMASATALALAVTVTPLAAADPVPRPADGGEAQSLGGKVNSALSSRKVSGPLAKSNGEVSVYVQLEGAGAFEEVEVKTRKRDTNRVKRIRSDVEGKGRELARASDSRVLYTTSNALRGVALRGDAEDLRELATREDVTKISAIVPKYPTNRGSVIDTGSLESWTALEKTGKGVKIAVLDTGVDYTHAGFGGPGTLEAYAQAQASEALPSADTGLRDPEKFIGGWDLVGDDYNANPSDPDYQPVPKPDPNPLDCQSAGHGSHVAGSSSGYGVTADGATFRGDYTSLTAEQVAQMHVGPGTAPESQIIGIRVFGCAGSSAVVGQALDYVLDPNGDGDFSDRAHVVNMSLGSDRSPTDDPENDIVDALTKAGILSVVASGNAGDVTDVGGSPGNSRSSLTVANTVGSQVTMDAVQVDAPADLAGNVAGQYSVNFDYTSADPAALSGDVVMAPEANRFGCQAFEAGSLEGQWVWLQWSENGEFPCGSGARFDNAAAAGATGVLLDSETNLFDAGIAGNAVIPGAQLTRDNSETLRAAAQAETLSVTLSPDLIGAASGNSGAKDTLNSSSSRGVHGSNGIVKPDVAAPGTQIGSVAVGTGNKPSVKSGTSMATPMVAGIAALVLEGTDYTPEQAKSLIMNTAATDVLATNGEPYGPNRVGTGRVMADAAITSPAYAYDSKNPDLTSVVFGVIELDAKKKFSATRSITVKNTSAKTVKYQLKYIPSTSIPGASYKLDRSSVKVAAGRSAKVKVTLNIDPRKFSKTLDPTMDAVQSGLARQWVSDVTGRVELSSPKAPTLRVPVQAAPKPTASMGAKVDQLKKGKNTTGIKLKGKDVQVGRGSGQVTSLLGAFELGATSPREAKRLDSIPAASAMDLQYVGASSTAGKTGVADGLVNIGISTWENWANLAGATELDIEFDTDADGQADFVSFTTQIDGIDLDLVATFDLANGEQVDLQPVNGVLGDVDTNSFDTNVAILPVALSALGLDESSTEISYRVQAYSWYHTDDDGALVPVDETEWISFDVSAPQLDFGASGTLFTDVKNTRIPVTVKDTAKESKVLLLHLHNATGNLDGKKTKKKADINDGDRAQVLTIAPAKKGKGKGNK
ncbi:S8 family serine peptidase [Glutamicibacter sp. MNS18]|uniref:S8 family serine peptidase n=1 Tax=Glutamicibacter sp. MNS18 TaxID=2989817 RepID=UPI0022368180|nr:S8 family serine peptidase [Glutamicibacter sp. MNS18]MCW4465838.1 S8 family serine peptidase [Glutamicibacter sp. MNS18]